jgi:hypothetical protein
LNVDESRQVSTITQLSGWSEKRSFTDVGLISENTFTLLQLVQNSAGASDFQIVH